MTQTPRCDSARPEPNPSPWWRATLIATFIWLCIAYLIGNKCGGMGLIGPCKMIMYESPLTAWVGVGWIVAALFIIPALALVALVQTFRRAMRPLPPQPREPGND